MEILENILLSGPDLKDVIVSLLIAAILGIIIAQLYRFTHRGLNYEHILP